VDAASSSRGSAAVVALAFLSGLTACGGERSAACSSEDGALRNAAFVFVEQPASGEHAGNGFRVRGCSTTFEATLAWTLRGRDGRELAHGVAQGGSIEPGPFAFTVGYSVPRREIGSLEVYEPPVTDEGFPPPRDLVPLVLE
jgi:Immunoglobulin-like domain of bacterial spore germination